MLLFADFAKSSRNRYDLWMEGPFCRGPDEEFDLVEPHGELSVEKLPKYLVELSFNDSDDIHQHVRLVLGLRL